MRAAPVRYPGLDPDIAEHREILTKTQAGILKGHGRDYSAFVFVRANIDVSLAQIAPLVQFPPQSAVEQYDLARQFEGGGDPTQPFISFLLSASGYRKLGIPPHFLPRDIAFRQGMKRASRLVLKDPPINTWNTFFQDEVDILTIIASNDQQVIEHKINEFINCISAIFATNFEVHTIWSKTLRNSEGSPTDVFGFVDGISHPLFFRRDINAYLQENSPLKWDPSMDPLNLVLVKDPIVTSGFGSYGVFRQLKQDRQKFTQVVQSIANNSGISLDYAESQFFGRFRNGTPLVSSANSDGNNISLLNFNYEADSSGMKCPLHAHIRKANPRTTDDDSVFRQIVRRGVPYQTNSSPLEEGLLFLCYQQDIGRQFEFQQSLWMNEPTFPQGFGDVGTDPVTATTSNRRTSGQVWRTNWGQSTPVRRLTVEQFVTVGGGEYLYCPPPTFIQDVLAASRV